MKAKNLNLYDKVVLNKGNNNTMTSFVVFIDRDAEIIHLRDNLMFDWQKRSFTFKELDKYNPVKVGKSIAPLMSVPFAWSFVLFFVLWAFIHYALPPLIIASSVCFVWCLFRSGRFDKKDVPSQADVLEKLLKKARNKEKKEVYEKEQREDC